MSAPIRETVYIIGAGFSHGCGYPLTNRLLAEVWLRLQDSDRTALSRILSFHYPHFDPANDSSFPPIERLMTQITINVDLFESSRRYVGKLTIADLKNAREVLFYEITRWFHELYLASSSTPWLSSFVSRARAQEAGIISFNWDLLLDSSLWPGGASPNRYGLTPTLPRLGPVILKPHGSLNWYDTKALKHVPTDSKKVLFSDRSSDESISAFLHPRAVRTKIGRNYTPILVAPTFVKDFSRPIFRQIWKHATEVLSTPKQIVFLGYSLPEDDMQARYILRCGFYNQLDGLLRRGGRTDPTGNAAIVIVDPSDATAQRIGRIANQGASITHHKMTVEAWLKSTTT